MLTAVLIEECEEVTIYRDIDFDLLLVLGERGSAALPWGIILYHFDAALMALRAVL